LTTYNNVDFGRVKFDGLTFLQTKVPIQYFRAIIL
jgi:hypothetical protein